MSKDYISDLIARINNAHMVRHKSVKGMPSSQMVRSILDVLARNGYIDSYEENEERKNIKSLNIKLKYYAGEPVIKEFKRVSKRSRRTYSPSKSLNSFSPMLGISIVSTPKGLLTCKEAAKHNVGGEVICTVF